MEFPLCSFVCGLAKRSHSIHHASSNGGLAPSLGIERISVAKFFIMTCHTNTVMPWFCQRFLEAGIGANRLTGNSTSSILILLSGD